MTIIQSSKFIVAITQRIDTVSGRDEIRDALDHRLVQWVASAGFIPFVVPNSLALTEEDGDVTLEHWLNVLRPDAFILSGGNDVGEYSKRDVTEDFILNWAKKRGAPVLGICRGMQMMATWAGADLVRREGHVGSRHQLVFIESQDQWPKNVNSYHNWCLTSCPKDFHVVAQAEDGSIEAMTHIKLPWEGWMWHPERETPFVIEDTKRLVRLFRE